MEGECKSGCSLESQSQGMPTAPRIDDDDQTVRLGLTEAKGLKGINFSIGALQANQAQLRAFSGLIEQGKLSIPTYGPESTKDSANEASQTTPTEENKTESQPVNSENVVVFVAPESTKKEKPQTPRKKRRAA